MENLDTESKQMSNFLELSKIVVLVFFCGMFVSGIVFSITKKNFLLTLLWSGLFLACLIFLLSLISSILIDENTLLQINATLIAGALILLTITSFVSKGTHKPIVIFGIAITPYQVGGGAIVAFSTSAVILFFHDIHLAKVIDVFGFIWLVASGFIITAKEQFDQGQS